MMVTLPSRGSLSDIWSAIRETIACQGGWIAVHHGWLAGQLDHHLNWLSTLPEVKPPRPKSEISGTRRPEIDRMNSE